MKNLRNARSFGIYFLAYFLVSSTAFTQIWKQPPLHRLTSEEYEMTLDFWAKKYQDRLIVERIGASAEGTGIFLLKITDYKIADDTKQVALITCLHSGPERSPTNAVLMFTEWLLSDDKEAIESRSKQVVLVIPIINPYSYFITDRFGNSQKIDPYTGGGASNWDFDNLIYKKAEEAQEVMAFLKVVDQYKPEVNLDLHGTGLQEYNDEQRKEKNHLSYRGQTMFEVTGMAYSNTVLRPWDWRITEAMVSAGKEAGFPSDRAEADAQQMHSIPGIGKGDRQSWSGRPQFFTAQYAYLKYHTLIGCLEVAWEESGVERAKGMLKIGNGVWSGEKISGYPVNKVYAFIGRYMTPWGITAKELRESRTELWQKHAAFASAIIYPETEGRESFILSLTEKGGQMLNADFSSFIDNLKKDPSINVQAIETFIKSGPQIKIASEIPGKTAMRNGPIEKGFGMRLRIPYLDAKVKELRLNGHLLQQSSMDGYETWVGDGYLQLQINVPPSKASVMDIAVVTCEYSTKTKRTYGWEPPKEVLDKLKKK
jgi:hypothetical protein